MDLVTFPLWGEQPWWAAKMLASVREHLPGWRIVQLSDMETAKLEEADEIVRLPMTGMRMRIEHLATLPHERLISLDTDVLLKADISWVFDKSPFDVALTVRDGDVRDQAGRNLSYVMPYNCGVMFSRGNDFWRDCAKVYPKEDWWGEQIAVKQVADSGYYRVLRLPCGRFNFTPSATTDLSDALVWHYKGNRKEMMRHA